MVFEELVKIEKEIKLKQQRIYVLAILELPKVVRDALPQKDLTKCQGTFLLGFSFPPHRGLVFPYEGHLWKLEHHPIQFPSRYYSRQPKHSAVIKPKWNGHYLGNEEYLVNILLNANSNGEPEDF